MAEETRPSSPPVLRIGRRWGLIDGATLFGIAGAFLLMALAIVLGGSVLAFFDFPSVLIVICGTVLITTASFSWGDMLRAAQDLGQTVRQRTRSGPDAARDVLRLADFARRHGILTLQGNIVGALKDQPVLQNGLKLVIEGTPDTEVEVLLRRDIAAQQSRIDKSATVLRRAAEISPAMGLIGTLIGLVQMLSQLSNPSAIGPGMAVALLTTFYGAILSNMVFSPLASKMERNSAEDQLIQHIHLLGVLSICRKDSPRRLEMQVNSLLPADQRVEGLQ